MGRTNSVHERGARSQHGPLNQAETELEALRYDLQGKESSLVDKSTSTELQEAKEAPATKLWKYAAHIKHMDQERSVSFHAMKKVDEDDV